MVHTLPTKNVTPTHTLTQSARPLSKIATFANEQRKRERKRFPAVRAAVGCATARASANRRIGQHTKAHANNVKRARLP